MGQGFPCPNFFGAQGFSLARREYSGAAWQGRHLRGCGRSITLPEGEGPGVFRAGRSLRTVLSPPGFSSDPEPDRGRALPAAGLRTPFRPSPGPPGLQDPGGLPLRRGSSRPSRAHGNPDPQGGGARNPLARVVVVAEAVDERTAFPLLRLGVKGLMTFAELPAQFARALQAVAGGGFWIPRAILEQFVESVTSRSSARRVSWRTCT